LALLPLVLLPLALCAGLREPDDFRGVIKWIVALRPGAFLTAFYDLSRQPPDR
jgi:hypothetical protein